MRLPLPLIATFFVSACASAGGTGVELPRIPDVDDRDAVEYRGVPGFDTRDYPGDGVMARWQEYSPYEWVGYYLPAPCYTGTSWVGKLPALRDMGWGTAILYVGEQDWRAIGGAPSMTEPDADEEPRCASENLLPSNGVAHAGDAADRAAAEGFPAGSTIYLDVERVSDVSPELAGYVGAWIGAMLDDGRYSPGLYAHERNVAALMDIASAEYRARGRSGAPRLWVASTEGFDIRAAPAESGVRGATIWQGALDVRERWGDVELHIDENVAAVANPSAP